MAGNFFKGTSVDQDGRWGKSDERLLQNMKKAGKFNAILDTKVRTCSISPIYTPVCAGVLVLYDLYLNIVDSL